MSNPRIVITEASAISAAGVGLEALGASLSASPKTETVKSFEFHELSRDVPCFRVSGFDPVAILGKKGLRTKDYATKLLLSAIELACKARYESTVEDDKPGICVGTAFGSVQSIGDFLSDSIVNGVNAVNPQAFANTVINSPTGNANIRYEVKTLSTTVATGFNASLDALIYSADYIRRGYIQSIVAGGLEEISYYALLGMIRSGVLSESNSMQPFGVNADGFVAGEGCAMFLLETEESAKTRGAAILAEIAGYGAAFEPDVFAGSWPAESRATQFAMKEACAQAGISPADIDFVAASANGIKAGDAMEAQAIAEVFGDVPVAAYKGAIGECYGAGPALMVACALADMKAKRISGVASTYKTISGINIVKEAVENRQSSHALINAVSCDGNCCALVIRNAEK
jgi:3-oxoacyl-(acyl-carrier-protein) synthase